MKSFFLLSIIFFSHFGYSQGKLFSIRDLKYISQLNIDSFETFALQQGYEIDIQRADYSSYKCKIVEKDGKHNKISLTFYQDKPTLATFITSNPNYLLPIKKSISDTGFVFHGTRPFGLGVKDFSDYKDYVKGKEIISTFSYKYGSSTMYAIQYSDYTNFAN